MGTAVAVVALAVAGTLMWKRRLPKIVALLALVAGAGLSSGFLGRLLERGIDGAASLMGSLTSAAFGAAVPAVLAVVGLIVFIHDLWPGNRAGRLTAGVGLALPPLLGHLGGAAGSIAGSGVEAVGSAVGGALGALFGVGGA